VLLVRILKNSFRSYLVMATLLCGCAAESTSTAVAPYQSNIFYLPSSIGPIATTVTNTTDPSLPEDQSKKLLNALWGVALGPLALAAPLYAGAFIVGGGLIVTLGALAYGIEKSEYNAILRAVTESNFAALLADVLQSRALPLQPPNSETTAQALVVLGGFGIAGNCFVAAAQLSVDQNNQRIMDEPLQLTIAERSADAPPLQCANLSHFAANDGRLIRETARDYAEVFAVMVADRLNRLQP
jgi:hypothetical protein